MVVMTETIQLGDKQVPVYGAAHASVGGQNRYYHFCTSNGQQRCYGVCAGMVDAYLEKRRWIMDEDEEDSCAVAMKRGNCQALDKRKLERKLDKAIFYKEKQVFEHHVSTPPEKRDAGYWRGWNQVGASLATKSKAVDVVTPPKPVVAPSVSPLSYEAAINSAIQNNQ